MPQLPQSGSFEQLSKSPSLHEMHNVDPASMAPPEGAREVLRAQGLRSTLFEWLSARMGRSILRSADAQAADPVSTLGAAIRWRREQNGAISASAATLDGVRRCKFSACGILDNRSKITLQLIFHPYDLRLLIGIDDHERICAWDVKEGVLKCEWLNTNRAGALSSAACSAALRARPTVAYARPATTREGVRRPTFYSIVCRPALTCARALSLPPAPRLPRALSTRHAHHRG